MYRTKKNNFCCLVDFVSKRSFTKHLAVLWKKKKIYFKSEQEQDFTNVTGKHAVYQQKSQQKIENKYIKVSIFQVINQPSLVKRFARIMKVCLLSPKVDVWETTKQLTEYLWHTVYFEMWNKSFFNMSEMFIGLIDVNYLCWYLF